MADIGMMEVDEINLTEDSADEIIPKNAQE